MEITISREEYREYIQDNIKLKILFEMARGGEPDYRIMDMFRALFDIKETK